MTNLYYRRAMAAKAERWSSTNWFNREPVVDDAFKLAKILGLPLENSIIDVVNGKLSLGIDGQFVKANPGDWVLIYPNGGIAVMKEGTFELNYTKDYGGDATTVKAVDLVGKWPEIRPFVHSNPRLVTNERVCRGVTWKERLLSWPWRPWRNYRCEYAEVPNRQIYKAGPVWMMHPVMIKHIEIIVAGMNRTVKVDLREKG